MSSIENINRLIIPNDVIFRIAQVYKYIGKTKYYEDMLKGDNDKAIESTIEKDTYFLSLLLNLKITDQRMRLIITKDSHPRTKDESVLYNLKEIITIFQKKTNTVEIQSNDLLNIMNYIYNSDIKYAMTPSDKRISLKSQEMVNKRSILNSFYNILNENIQKNNVEPIILYTHYFIDFYNLAPFSINNETIAFLLLYLTVLKSEVNAFKYVSFFELLFEEAEEYETNLKDASFNWKEGYAQTIDFINFILKLSIVAYKKTEELIKNYEFDRRMNKSKNLENSILNMASIFTKDELREIYPYISESTINRSLIKMRDSGFIKPIGKGRSAKWMKCK